MAGEGLDQPAGLRDGETEAVDQHQRLPSPVIS